MFYLHKHNVLKYDSSTTPIPAIETPLPTVLENILRAKFIKFAILHGNPMQNRIYLNKIEKKGYDYGKRKF